MTGNGICSACFLRKRRHCEKRVPPSPSPPVPPPPLGELGTKCQKGNWRHDVPNEGALTDAANGCSPLIRLLPTVAATFPPRGKAFGKTANFTVPPKAPPRGELSHSD